MVDPECNARMFFAHVSIAGLIGPLIGYLVAAGLTRKVPRWEFDNFLEHSMAGILVALYALYVICVVKG